MLKNVCWIPALILVVSCGGDEVTPAGKPAVETEEQSAIGEPVPIEGTTDLTIEETKQPSLFDTATLRSSAGERAEGESEVEKDFEIGETIQLEVTVLEVPKMLAAWVHWIDSEGEKVAEEEKSVPQNRTVAFEADTTDWSPGEYTVEIYIGGDLAETKSFRLTEGDSADAE